MKRLLVLPLMIMASFIYAHPMSDSMNDVLKGLGKVFTENSSLLNTQSDSYIGNLPHFTLGSTTTATLINTSDITDGVFDFVKGVEVELKDAGALDSFSTGFSLPSKLPIPNTAFTVRLGGLFIPFDIGLYGISSFNFAKDIGSDSMKFNAQYTAIGFDFRYALFKGSKYKTKLSLIGGYGYVGINFDGHMKENVEFNSDYNAYMTDDRSVTIDSAFDLKLNAHTFKIGGQVSRRFLIFTPYFGLNTLINVYDVKSEWYFKAIASKTDYQRYVKDIGNKDSSSSTSADFCFQFTGGCDMKLGIVQLLLGLGYNPMKNYPSCVLSANLKF